jgi:outer membrane protein TolC
MSGRTLLVFFLVLGLGSPAPVAAGTPPRADLENDPRLDQPLTIQDCIDLAIDNNLTLRVARLDQERMHSSARGATGIYWPVINVNGERNNIHFFGEFPDQTQHLINGHADVTQFLPLGTSVMLAYDSYHSILQPDRTDAPADLWSFGITQPLLRGGWWQTGTANVRVARASARLADASLEAARLDVVRQVKTAYYEVMRQGKLIEVNGRAVGRDSQLVLESRSKLEAGLGTKRDVLSAEIVLEQDRGKLVDAQTGHMEALDVVARSLGLRLGVHDLRLADESAPLDTVAVHEDAWVAKAMHDNPQVRAAQMAAERSRIEMQAAGNGRLPQLDLNFNYTSFDDPDLNEYLKDLNKIRVLEGKEPKDLKFTAHTGYQTLLTFSYPLGNRTLGEAFREKRYAHDQALILLADTQRQISLDVRSAVRALESTVERLGILKKNIEGAQNKLEFATVNFQLGRASNLDITDAQKDLLKAQTDYVNAIVDYQVRLATIEALVGGFE